MLVFVQKESRLGKGGREALRSDLGACHARSRSSPLSYPLSLPPCIILVSALIMGAFLTTDTSFPKVLKYARFRLTGLGQSPIGLIDYFFVRLRFVVLTFFVRIKCAMECCERNAAVNVGKKSQEQTKCISDF